MATSVKNMTPNMADDATFRAYFQAVHDALAAIGLTQTADTGQINLATVTKPGSSNTAAGYEVWRFSDAKQASAPIYIKIEYGVAGTTTPSIWLTVGTTTDGAGTIAGQVTARTQTGGTNSATASDSYFSYVDGRLQFMLHGAATSGNTGHVIGVLIERVRSNTDGTDGDDFVVIQVNQGYNWRYNYIPRSGSAPSQISNATGHFMVGFRDAAAPTSDKGAAPCFPIYGYPRPPMIGMLVGGSTDFAVSSDYTVARGAANRTYRGCRNPGISACQHGSASSQTILMLWE